MGIHILVVEDDLYIQELISEFLKAQNFKVSVAEDGTVAWQMIKEEEYDLVILDIMLPNMDGYLLCKMIRQKSSVPIIILTALSEEKDQLKAFELEADDFISKPFSFNVLVKRVEAVLRRGKGSQMATDELVLGKIKLDCGGYKVYVNNQLIDLTAKEFEILKMLIENKGKVMTREMLVDKIWGYDYFGDNRIVDAHIKNLRKKINLSYIKTVKGIGYTLERDSHEE
jgi:two-component system response regulator VanR